MRLLRRARVAAAVIAASASVWIPFAEAQPRDNRGDSEAELSRRGSRWVDSQITLWATANGAFFDRSYTESGSVTRAFDVHLSIAPRLRIGRGFQLRAWWGVEVELTDASHTTTKRELRSTDAELSAWYLGLPSLGEWRVALAAGVSLPLSVESRANTTILTPFAVAQTSWAASALAGRFTAVARLGYAHVFMSYSTPSLRGGFPFARVAVVRGEDTDQLRGLTNIHDRLWTALTLTQSWGRLSLGTHLAMNFGWAYPAHSTDGIPTDMPDGAVREWSSFSAWLGVGVTSFLTVETGYTITRDVLDADGTYGNPFYDRFRDWRVYLSLNLEPDRIADALNGRGAGYGRAVVARRERAPTP